MLKAIAKALASYDGSADLIDIAYHVRGQSCRAIPIADIRANLERLRELGVVMMHGERFMFVDRVSPPIPED